MQAWQATVQDEFGNIVTNPSITVYLANGTTLAQIYNENETPKANPFIGTLDGFVQFWAPDGDYKIRGSKGAENTELWSVTLDLTAQEAVDAAAAAAGSASLALTRANNAATSANNAATSAGTATTEANRATAAADRAAGVFQFRGELDGHMARMKAGEAVTIACYGDSTVDGNGTVGWTANPTNADGTAIGTAAHTPPNAWPALMQTMMRRMYVNTTLEVWNAGYGGKDIVTGWAAANFATAVINNPAYGTPDICIVNFGLNDVVRAPYTVALFRQRVDEFVTLLAGYGITPVFLTPDPVIESGPRQGGALSEIVQVYRDVAEARGITIIDSQSALERTFSVGGTNSLWAYIQPDDLHFGNVGHRVKAGFVSASMFPNTLWIKDAEPVNVAAWSKHSNAQERTYTLFDDANNRFGASMNVAANSYTLGQALLDVWVWTDTPNMRAYWRSVSGDGYYEPSPLANAPELEAASYLTGAVVNIKSPTAGYTQQPGTTRDSETPGFLSNLTAGLNRLTYVAPTDRVDRVLFLGYFSLRPTDAGTPNTYAAFWGAGGSGRQVFDQDAYEVRAPLVGAGITSSFNMLVDAAMPDGAGFFIYTGRIFGDGTGGVSQRQRGLVLQRAGANAVLLDIVYQASGVATRTQLASVAYTWNETSNEFNIRGGNGTGNQFVIQITPSATPLSPLITLSRDITVAPPIMGGHIGAVYKDYGTSVAGGRSRITFHGL